MKTEDLLLLGALGVGAYFLFKGLSPGSGAQQGGGYSQGWIPGDTTPQTPMNTDENTPTVKPTGNDGIIHTPFQEPWLEERDGITTVVPLPSPSKKIRDTLTYIIDGTKAINIPAPIGVTQETLSSNVAGSWTGATYGQKGQPSVAFLSKTISQAKYSPTPASKLAVAGIAAGAPPRIVAKLKAGKVY